jgi:hypothetical protein
VEENGRELAQSFVDAAKRGDWRGADVLMNRIYGKPERALITVAPPNAAVEMIRSLSLDREVGDASPFAGRRVACAVSLESHEPERSPCRDRALVVVL